MFFFAFFSRHVQIDSAESNAAKLSLVSPLLGNVFTLARAEIDDLCVTHGFEFNQSNGVAFSSLNSCTTSVHLYPPWLPSEIEINNAETALVFATSAMQQFENKLNGTDNAMMKRRKVESIEEKSKEEDSGRSDCGGDAGDEFNVSEYVEALIEEATSVDNLARMFEGWMPWI
jgi:uncharacterized low-complexity protein